MIDQNLLDAVKSYSENMTRPITFVLGNGTHAKRAELVDFFDQDCWNDRQNQFRCRSN